MISVFLSYRRFDYETSVKQVEDALILEFGKNSIILDQSNFVAGEEWLPQIRIHVIQADVIICIIGESWLTKSQKDDDFVCQELNLARNLGKPIIPVVLNSIDLNSVLEKIPDSIQWLVSLQVIKINYATSSGYLALNESIRNLIGSKAERKEKTKIFVPTFYNSFRKTIKSAFYPLSVAGSSLRPDTTSLITSANSLIIAGLIVILIGTVNSRAIMTIERFARLQISSFEFLLIIFSIGFLTSIIFKRKLSVLSLTSFSLQFCATIILVFSVYFYTAALILGGEAIVAFQLAADSSTSAYIFFDKIAETILPKIDPSTFAILSIINWAFAAHLIYIIWGYLRALVAVFITSKSLSMIFFVGTLLFASCIVYFTLLVDNTFTPGSDGFNEKLPKNIEYMNGTDALVNGKVERMPIKIKANGILSKEGDLIVIRIKELTISNRTKKSFRPVIFCNLGKIKKNGEFLSWPEPTPFSGYFFIETVNSGSERKVQNIVLRLNLPRFMQSGETGLYTFVNLQDEVTPLIHLVPSTNEGNPTLKW